MEIKLTDMPSKLWKIWFVATKMRLGILALTTVSGFMAVFIVSPSSAAFTALAVIAGIGLLFVGVQQFFDIRYARKYLFSKPSVVAQSSD